MSLWLVDTNHMTSILFYDWSILITWPQYSPIIGPYQVCWVWGCHPGQVYQRPGDNLAPGVLQVQGLRPAVNTALWSVNTSLWLVDKGLWSPRCFLSELWANLSTLSLSFSLPFLLALLLRTLSIRCLLISLFINVTILFSCSLAMTVFTRGTMEPSARIVTLVSLP